METTHPRLLILALAAMLLAGCASVSAHRHKAELLQAQSDDQYCQNNGWRWPSERYVTCRLDLADARARKQYSHYQMMRRTNETNTPMADEPPQPLSGYKPLSRDKYGCHPYQEGDTLYILCSENDTGGMAGGP